MATLKNADLSNVSFGNLFRFALPLIATSFIQQLFNSADSAVVGRFVGSQALAAVGGNSAVVNLLINMFTGLSVGANVIVARYLGEKNGKKVSESVLSVFILSIFCGISVALIGLFLAKPVLVLIDTPADILDLAVTYLRLYFSGMPFFMIYTFGAAVLRSNGETRKPLTALFCSGAINVFLNLLFVIVFHMGVKGVGLATIISNAISAILVIVFLVNRNDCLKLDFKKKFSFMVIKRTMIVGIPAGIQGTVFSLSNVVVLSAINSFGSNAAAGSTASLLYEQFSYFITAAFSQTAVSYVSHNYGAGNIENCLTTFRKCFLLAFFGEMIFDLTLIAFRYPLLKVFTSDPKVMQFAIQKAFIVIGLHFLCSTYEVSGGCLRGFGKSLTPALLTLTFSCGVRLIWVFAVLPLHRTFLFLFLVYPISWILSGITVTSAYFKFAKQIRIE